jgi:transcriptional regulator with GAF, ATPase, and Fis domain
MREQQTTIAKQVKEALENTDSKSAAARLLGIDRATLDYHMERFGIVVEEKRCRKIVIENERVS